jgi:hypothetical protein
MPKKTAVFLLLTVACSVSTLPVWSNETASGNEAHGSAADVEHAEQEHHFGLGRQASWLFRSFLQDETDDNTVLGLEFESAFGLGSFKVKNISYFEVARYARGVPGQPPGNPDPGVRPADGINDLLTAFWFSKRGAHHGKHHFSLGFAAQFPTASDKTLGSGKYSLGPSFDYEFSSGRWFAGAIALQLWSVAGDEDRKSVSMLMVKPFAYYTINERWDLMYVPYGIQVYWNKPSGEQVYLPLGGGAQRKIDLGSTQMNLGLAAYYNVIRPTKGAVWDLRLLVEFNLWR